MSSTSMASSHSSLDNSIQFAPSFSTKGTSNFPEAWDGGSGVHADAFPLRHIQHQPPQLLPEVHVSSIWSQHANRMGYVAIATDETEIRRLGRRDIVIAWRGTVTYLEWLHDLKDILHPAHFRDDPSIKIESGFLDLYTSKEKTCKYCAFSAREQVLAELSRLVHRYRGVKLSITITVHSLGAALALVSAYDIAEVKLNVEDDGHEVINEIPITVFSFSGPRVGNLKFKERCDELGIKALRVVNVPPFWWQDEHKGMVRTPDGRWTLPDRPWIESHPPDTAHHFEQVIKYARSRWDWL